MGKPKNKSKGKDLDYDSEPEAVEEMEEKDSKPAAKASKKAKKKNKKDDDWEDDIAAELESLSMDVNKGNKEKEVEEEETPAPVKKEKKKKKKKQDSDDEEMDEDVPAVNLGKKKAAFNMLMMEDEEEEEKDKSEESEEEVVKVEKPVKQQKKKENKKKGKEKTAEEEDLDALLAEIDKPTEKTSKKSKKDKKKEASAEAEENGTEEKEPTPEVQKVEPKIVTIDDLDDDEDDKKKKKKKGKEKKDTAEEGEKEGDKEGEDEDGGTVKTAAQKKKEKKERERLKKLADKKKQGQKDTSKPAEQKVAAEPTEQESAAPDTAEQSAMEAAEDKDEKAGSGNEDEGEAEGKKKKKKKKGEKEEAEKKKRKAPVAAIKEMLQRQKEEEERLKREEEERIRKEEEAHQAYLEKKRIEEEKKAKKREKEKERKARLKAEGKWTAQQKQERLRAQQLLEAQGLDLPKKEEQEETEEKKKKRPIYVDKKKMKKKMQVDDAQPGETPSPEETPTQTPAETPVTEELPSESPLAPEVEEKKEPKDDWMESSEEEEEEEEEDEKESSPEQEETTKIEIKDKADAEEESDEEDEDDDDDEEDEDEDDEEEEEEESSDDDDLTAYDRAEKKIQKFHAKCEAARSTDNLRAPVVVVLGHVDTGKTKILDKLRRTNVQDGEAGGITQQIGATNVPKYAILEKTTMCKEFQKKELKLPGLLIIDTPGHESFSNLRSRGSSLCDIAILVIDIMHGLEPQTIESINLLKDRKTPFVVALNKIDRLYQWKSNPNNDVTNTIKKQGPMAKAEFDERARKVIVELAEQGLNAALFYENKNPKEYISLVPTSAHSGDGMGNLVALICELTQTWLAKKVSYSEELQATVMEVKSLPGLGTTIDVILVNGTLREGDHIVIAGTEGPIVTQIRGLLMPQPMKEFRVKGTYDHYKEVKAAQGVKVIGKDMEKALAGLPLYVASNDDEVEYYKQELSDALKDVLNSIKCVERGVFVQASTLGSLEALLEFLRTSEIPYAGINIGPVHRKDIMRASVMLEHDSQWAVILAFDVKVERDAQEMADNLGVRIFTADIIYHLEDKFLKFREDLKRQKQEEFKHIAVFPCKLRVLPQYIFNSRDPIVMGVVVEAGVVKMGTPICVPSKEFVFLGQITSIEVNHKQQDVARKGQEVCIKIENVPGETPKLYGRHFDHTDMLVSRVSRASIDAVKNHFREDMTKPDWALMVELKKLFQIL